MIFEVFKDLIYFAVGHLPVVRTTTKKAKFFLKCFFAIEKFTKKAFQRRVARRYTIKPRVSRFKRNFFEISDFW